MPPTLFDNPKHWRERASEARAIADQVNEPEAKRMMLEIAQTYEQLAERAEARAARPSPKSE